MKPFLRRVFSIATLILLAACVPDQSGSNSRSQQHYNSQSQAQADRDAMAMVQFAQEGRREVEIAIASGAALPDGVLPNQPASPASLEMAVGHCADTSVTPPRSMVVTWKKDPGTDKPNGALARSVSSMNPGALTGIMSGGVIDLSSVRRGTDQMEIALPAGCTLPIPDGAPVLIHEIERNMQAGAHTRAGYSYDIDPAGCPPGMIGARVNRTYAQTDDEGNAIAGTERTDLSLDGCMDAPPPPAVPPPPPTAIAAPAAPPTATGKIRWIESCIGAGGHPAEAGADLICRFNASSCPGDWTQFGSWQTSSSHTCAPSYSYFWDDSRCRTSSYYVGGYNYGRRGGNIGGSCGTPRSAFPTVTVSGQAWSPHSPSIQAWNVWQNVCGCACGSEHCTNTTMGCRAVTTQIGCIPDPSTGIAWPF